MQEAEASQGGEVPKAGGRSCSTIFHNALYDRDDTMLRAGDGFTPDLVFDVDVQRDPMFDFDAATHGTFGQFTVICFLIELSTYHVGQRYGHADDLSSSRYMPL